MMASFKKLSLFFCLLISVIVAVKLPQDSNPQPLSWWQQQVIYQITPGSFPLGDLQEGILSRLDHFTNLGVGALWISSMKESDYSSFNFTDIDPAFGTLDTFQNFSHALKQKDIRLIVDLFPNHSSHLHPWFNASIYRQDPYTDYYVWRNASSYDSQGRAIPPNNWVGVFGGSMWEWNDQRQQFYLHQFLKEQPDLNFENPRVVNEMLAVMKVWLDRGVDGFNVHAVSHLFEDVATVDEEINDEFEDPNRPLSSTLLDYSFWEHRHTYNLPACLDVVADMRKLLDVYSLADGRERILMVEAKVPLPQLFKYYGTREKPMAQVPLNFGISQKFNASQLQSVLAVWFDNLKNGQSANWLVENSDNKVGFGEEYHVDFLNMLVLLLPGSVVTYSGQEFGIKNASWEDTIANKTWLPLDSADLEQFSVAEELGNEKIIGHLKVYKRLVKLRNTNVWRYGSLETKIIQGEGEEQSTLPASVFGFTRIFNGSGFMVLTSNSISNENERIIINAAEEFEGVPPTATIYAASINFDYLDEDENSVIEAADTVNTSSIVLIGLHAIVLQF